jgi:hypothetical protein
MAKIRDWDNLSDGYRKQLVRGGITKASYEQGADLRAARRHYYTPERPGRTAPAALSQQFSEQLAHGDEISHTYVPTKTTWPGNGWDHRRTTEAGYDRDRQLLEIQFFTDGSVYRYSNVTQAQAQAFRRARSPGQFINAILMDGTHPYERIS